jgi:hypothetical protein
VATIAFHSAIVGMIFGLAVREGASLVMRKELSVNQM